MGITRRQFLKSAFVIPTSVYVFGMGCKEKKEDKIIDDFVKNISKYDIVHFGEGHKVRNPNETSALEDFVDLFLPKFRDKKLVGKPYTLIRVEHLPYENDDYVRSFLTEEELKNFDATGIITPDKTPLFFEEVLKFRGHKDPIGTKKVALEGVACGYKVRGLGPSRDYLNSLEKTAKEEGFDELVVEIMFSETTNKYYLSSIREDIKKHRIIVYGGGAHNDNDNIFESLILEELKIGIADEMKKEFPGKYVAIDLIKPSIVDPNSDYFQYYKNILKFKGFDVNKLDEILIIIPETSERADYIVFLPPRIKS